MNILSIFYRLFLSFRALYLFHKMRTFFRKSVGSFMQLLRSDRNTCAIETREETNLQLVLQNILIYMNFAVQGQEKAKKKILPLMLSYLQSKRPLHFVISGPPGSGKMTLVREAVAKALDLPFVSFSCNSIENAALLQKGVKEIVEQDREPTIVYFDAMEHLPEVEGYDSYMFYLLQLLQREKSQMVNAIFVFSYSDPSAVHTALQKDIPNISFNPLSSQDKASILQKKLVPNILKQKGITSALLFPEEVLQSISEHYIADKGMQNIERYLHDFIDTMHVRLLLEDRASAPYSVTVEDIENSVEETAPPLPSIHTQPHIGVINGLFYSDEGYGGILPIQVTYAPCAGAFEIKTTGNQGSLMVESAQVAFTVAWNMLSTTQKQTYLDSPYGVHVHLPDPSVKDGYSTGVAKVLAFFSLLTDCPIRHDVAITGEIDLLGYTLPIGGLAEKIRGAKKAGITSVLIPYGNVEEWQTIAQENPSLCDNSFKVLAIEHVQEAIEHVLLWNVKGMKATQKKLGSK